MLACVVTQGWGDKGLLSASQGSCKQTTLHLHLYTPRHLTCSVQDGLLNQDGKEHSRR